jgi:FtsP/CotA-like multicopper oxidase with cupredoxin domain
MISRRNFFSNAVVAAGAAALGATTRSVQGAEPPGQPLENSDKIKGNAQSDQQDYPPGEPGKDYIPVITPNGSTLPYKLVGGSKIFHLIAEEADHEFAPGLRAYCWGFNGQAHGPTIEAVEGDRVRIYVTNRLPESTSIHWHGVLVPSGMDGVAGLSQKNIEPGETYKYEFKLRQHGTFMYHSHTDEMTQIALGMMGMFIIHPRNPTGPKADRDFALTSSEWRIDVGTMRPTC